MNIVYCGKRGIIFMETLKLGTKSNPNSVAGALANVLREKDGGTVWNFRD